MKEKTLQDVLKKLNEEILTSMSETEGEFEKVSISIRETLEQIKEHKNLDPIVENLIRDVKNINREVRGAQTYKEFKQFGRQNEILTGIIEKHLEDGTEKVKILGELGKQQKILDENIRKKAKIFSRTASFWKKHGVSAAAVAGGLLGDSPAVMWAISAWGDYRKLKKEEKEAEARFKTNKLQQVRENILRSNQRKREKTFRFETDDDDFGTEQDEQKRKRTAKKRSARNKKGARGQSGLNAVAEDLLSKQLSSLINIETTAFNIYKFLQDKAHKDYVQQKDEQTDFAEAILEKDNDEKTSEQKREKEKDEKDGASLSKKSIITGAVVTAASIGTAIVSGIANAERRGVDKSVGGMSAAMKPIAATAIGTAAGAKLGGMLGSRFGPAGALIGGAGGAIAGATLELTSSEEEKRLQAIGLQHAIDQSRLGLSKVKAAFYKMNRENYEAQLENEFQEELKRKQHQRLVDGYWAEREYNLQNDLKNLRDEYYNAKKRYSQAETEEEQLAALKQMEAADALHAAKEIELKKLEEDNQKRKEENLKREKEIEKLKEEKLKREQYKLDFNLQKKDFMSSGGFRLSGTGEESRTRERELNRSVLDSYNYQNELMQGIRSGKPIDPKTGKRISVIQAAKLLQKAQNKRVKDIQNLVGEEERSGGWAVSAGGLTVPGVNLKPGAVAAPEQRGRRNSWRRLKGGSAEERRGRVRMSRGEAIREEGPMSATTIDGKRGFDQKAAAVMARLQQDLGISKEDAAAIVGNLGHESAGLQPDINEGKPSVPGSRGGYGWAQWTGPRRREFEAFAKERNLDITTDEANYQFLVHELKGSEKRSLEKLSQANTLEEKTVAFERAYERAGVKHDDKRISYARRAMMPSDPESGALYHQVAANNAVSKIDAAVSKPTVIAANTGGGATVPPQQPSQAPGMGRGAPRGQEPTIWSAMATDHSGNTA